VDLVEWPSLNARILLAYRPPDQYGLRYPLVAEDSGDLICFVAPSDQHRGGEVEVRRVRRVGSEFKAERTKLSLNEVPWSAAISPDGRSLAIVRRDGKLIVCDLQTGAKRAVTGFEADRNATVGLEWALGGQAILVAEKSKVWLIPVDRQK
jgi:hypothetical protein